MRKSNLQKVLEDNIRVMTDQRERINALVEENASLKSRLKSSSDNLGLSSEVFSRLSDFKRALLSVLVALDDGFPELRRLHAVEEDYYLELSRLSGISSAIDADDGRMPIGELDALIAEIGGVED